MIEHVNEIEYYDAIKSTPSIAFQQGLNHEEDIFVDEEFVTAFCNQEIIQESDSMTAEIT